MLKKERNTPRKARNIIYVYVYIYSLYTYIWTHVIFRVQHEVGQFRISHITSCSIQLDNSVHSSQWRHNERDGVSNHRHLHCLLNCWFRRRSNKTSKYRVTVTGEFPTQRASNAENVSNWLINHVILSSVRRPLPSADGCVVPFVTADTDVKMNLLS